MSATRERKIIENLFAKLKKAERQKFPKQRQRLDASSRKGVYIIYCPKGNILHVGSTPRAKGGIAQRLRNHLQGQSSFTQQHFKQYKKRGPQLRDGYGYSCLAVDGNRHRALLEAYAIGHLCPRHIGHGARNGKVNLG